MSDRYGAVRTGNRKGMKKTALPIGTITIRSDLVNGRRLKSRYIKVRMEGPPQQRWQLYARWWWEGNKGPILPGKIVLHADGKTMNDDPSNLALGTHGDKAVLAHMRDPEWSEAQYRSAGRGTAEHNRFAGKLHRLRYVIPAYWYPVLDDSGVIFNVPFRRRKPLYAWFGGDVSAYPRNGQIRHLELSCPVRAVRGCDLAQGVLETYLRVDPEFVVSTGRDQWTKEQERQVEALRKTEVWKRAEEAARKDLRERA